MKMTKEEQINYFRESMISTKREGMADLLDFMVDLGFLTAPHPVAIIYPLMAVFWNILSTSCSWLKKSV